MDGAASPCAKFPSSHEIEYWQGTGHDASAFRRIPGPLSQKLIPGAVVEDEAHAGRVAVRRALLPLVFSPKPGNPAEAAGYQQGDGTRESPEQP